MCKDLRTAIYEAIENSMAISYSDDVEILSAEVYAAIAPFIREIQQMRLHQRIYSAVKTQNALKRAIHYEQSIDLHFGKTEEVEVFQPLIF